MSGVVVTSTRTSCCPGLTGYTVVPPGLSTISLGSKEDELGSLPRERRTLREVCRYTTTSRTFGSEWTGVKRSGSGPYWCQGRGPVSVSDSKSDEEGLAGRGESWGPRDLSSVSLLGGSSAVIYGRGSGTVAQEFDLRSDS